MTISVAPDTRAAPRPDRALVEQIFAALPDLWRHHAAGTPLYRHLDGVLRAYFEGGTDERIAMAPFADLWWPRISLGNLSSYCFFTMGEMVLHAFYGRNDGRYGSFFDVGAHMGIDSLLAAHLGYRVHAFEPDPDHGRRMAEILARNGHPDVTVHGAAISDRAGETAFVRVQGNTTASHIAGARDFHGPVERVSVKTMTFEDVGWFPDLMKINVEGHESVVVGTIPAKVWDRMDAFIEVHDSPNRDRLWDNFQTIGVGLYSQKRGWRKARRPDHLPATNKEGYLFVSRKRRMPW